MFKPQNLATLVRLCQHKSIYQKVYHHLNKMHNTCHVISTASIPCSFTTPSRGLTCRPTNDTGSKPPCSQGKNENLEPPKPRCEPPKPKCEPPPPPEEPGCKCDDASQKPKSICDPPPKKPPSDAVTQNDQCKSGEPLKPWAPTNTCNGESSKQEARSSKPPEPKCTCGPPPEKCPENSKNDDMPIIPLKEARRFMYDCLVAAGASPEHASLHADMMIYADSRGIFGHGMSRLETICCSLKNKKISGKDIPEILNESPSCAYVDGKNALGAVIGCYCMDLAIKKAKICGVGFINTKNATPFGYASFYADRATKNGLIGLATSNGFPTVIPTRAIDPALGSNPLTIAAPISLCDSCNVDISASMGNLGKVQYFSQQNRELPSGWAMHEGKPTTDPNIVLEKGGLLPVGGISEETGSHKGFCISIVLEILTGILSGGDFGPKLSKDKECYNFSQTFVAINPEVFAPGFAERLKWFSHYLRNMPPLTPGKSVLMPGDVERKFADEIDIQGGIKYLKAQMGQCQRIADEFKVKHLGEAKPNV